VRHVRAALHVQQLHSGEQEHHCSVRCTRHTASSALWGGMALHAAVTLPKWRSTVKLPPEPALPPHI
jgi:archaeosine-15-forming tRNA-guanine transglycosylase